MNVTELRTNIRTDERKGENYIPVGINAGGIMTRKKQRKLKQVNQRFIIGIKFIKTQNNKLSSSFKISQFLSLAIIAINRHNTIKTMSHIRRKSAQCHRLTPTNAEEYMQFTRTYEPHQKRTGFCICEHTDQLRGNRKADQCLYFRYKEQSLYLTNPKFQASSLIQ